MDDITTTTEIESPTDDVTTTSTITISSLITIPSPITLIYDRCGPNAHKFWGHRDGHCPGPYCCFNGQCTYAYNEDDNGDLHENPKCFISNGCDPKYGYCIDDRDRVSNPECGNRAKQSCYGCCNHEICYHYVPENDKKGIIPYLCYIENGSDPESSYFCAENE